jgi:hypothetical protein
MRSPALFLLLATGSAAFAAAQTVPGTSPKDPADYKSPYAMKVTPEESCERQFQHLLLQTQRKIQLTAGITNSCKMADALQDVAQDHINFYQRCPAFPAAQQAAATNEANVKALRMQCLRPLKDAPPLPDPIIDSRGAMDGLAECIMPKDGRTLNRNEQGECIRKHGKRSN